MEPEHRKHYIIENSHYSGNEVDSTVQTSFSFRFKENKNALFALRMPLSQGSSECDHANRICMQLSE